MPTDTSSSSNKRRKITEPDEETTAVAESHLTNINMGDHEVSSLVLEYKWKGTVEIPEPRTKPKTILSEIINFCGEGTFQTSFKMDEHWIYKLGLKAVNLSKMGFKVNQVLVSAGSLPNQRRMAKDRINFDLSVGFLFSDLTPEQSLRQGERFTKFNFEFNFKIYMMATTIKDYRIQQVDSFMMDHLWSSVTNRTRTDFELISSIDKKSFSVHKFVLTARSPVFATMLSKDPDVSSLTESVDSTSMEQFLKFIYTGQLVGPVSGPNLGKMAFKYQLPTLEQLCTSARSLKNGISQTTGKNKKVIKSEGGEAKINYPAKAAAAILPWDLEWVMNDATSGDCAYSNSFTDKTGKDVYRVKAELTRQKPDTPLKTEVSASGASKSLHVYNKLKISIITNDAHLPTRVRIINKVGFKIVSSVKSSGYWDRHHKETKFIEKHNRHQAPSSPPKKS